MKQPKRATLRMSADLRRMSDLHRKTESTEMSHFLLAARLASGVKSVLEGRDIHLLPRRAIPERPHLLSPISY